MPWWYPFGCIAFIVGGILIFLKPDGMLGRATWNSLYGVTTRKA